jgi:subtilisin family serine protease
MPAAAATLFAVRRSVSIAALLALCSLSLARQPAGVTASAAAFANGRAVVGLAAGVDARAFAHELRLRLLREVTALHVVELAGRPSALARLAQRSDARLRYVEPVLRLEPAHVRDDPLTYEKDPETGVPYEWNFHQVGADQALNLSKGDAKMLVGVLDTGISPVSDLKGKIAETLPAGAASAEDTSGHGTLVSSIIAANVDDGIGLAGFCGACRLVIYRSFPLTSLEVAAGVRALTDARVRIINLSLTGQEASSAVTDALDYALAAGVLVVAASGNNGEGTVAFPASYLQAAGGAAGGGLAVGASDVDGNRASFSNWGSQLSLVAPGTYNTRCAYGVIGAIPSIATEFDSGLGCDATLFDTHGARYAYANGTSFAVPEVAGIAALVWAAAPGLTSVQVASVLEQTATRPSGVGWTPTMGWGILDAKAALEQVTGRSGADLIRLSGLRVSGRKLPAHTLRAAALATWGDGSRVVAGAIPHCKILLGRRSIKATASLVDGRLACSFTLPATSAGARVTGSISLTAEATPPAAAGFTIAIPRQKGK